MAGQSVECPKCGGSFSQTKRNAICPYCLNAINDESPGVSGGLKIRIIVSALVGVFALAGLVAGLLFMRKPAPVEDKDPDPAPMVEDKTPGEANPKVSVDVEIADLRRTLRTADDKGKLPILEKIKAKKDAALPLAPDLAALCTHANADVKIASLEALKEVGSGAKQELTKLVPPLADSNTDVQNIAREIWKQFEPYNEKDLPALQLLVNHQKADVKILGCQLVSKIRPLNTMAEGMLLNTLQDLTPEVRIAGVNACKAYSKEAKFRNRVFQDYSLVANDSDSTVREVVEKALIEMCPLSPEELAKFEPYLLSKNQLNLRRLALKIYAAMDVSLTGKEKSLLDGLALENPEIRILSLKALDKLHSEPLPSMVMAALKLSMDMAEGELGAMAEMVAAKGKITTEAELKQLAAFLHEKTPASTRSLALKILTNSSGINCHPVEMELSSLLAIKDESLAIEVLETIARQKNGISGLVPAIGPWTKVQKAELQVRAFAALKACGPGVNSLELIKGGLNSPDAKVALAALGNLALYDHEAKEPYQILLSFFTSPCVTTEENLKLRLAALREARVRHDKIKVKLKGDSLAPAIEVFSSFLTSSETKVVEEALEFLTTFGPETQAILPKLITALGYKDGQVVGPASSAVAAVGKSAINPLLKIMDSAQEKIFMKIGAVMALGKMGPVAKEAGPYLYKIQVQYTPFAQGNDNAKRLVEQAIEARANVTKK